MSNDTRFKKGKSGNPGGITSEMRAKQTAGREKALEHVHEAIEKIVHLMRNSKFESMQFAAAQELLDRGLGKPTQAVEMSGELLHRAARDLTEEELERIAAGGSAGAAETPPGEANPPGLH